MDENDARRWFGEYLEVFEACGRGEAALGPNVSTGRAELCDVMLGA